MPDDYQIHLLSETGDDGFNASVTLVISGPGYRFESNEMPIENMLNFFRDSVVAVEKMIAENARIRNKIGGAG